MFWPDFLKTPINLFNFPPWRYEMPQNEFLELSEFFQTDQEIFDENKKELLKQIHLGTVKWEYETQMLAKQLAEDGYIYFDLRVDDVFLTELGKKEIGL